MTTEQKETLERHKWVLKEGWEHLLRNHAEDPRIDPYNPLKVPTDCNYEMDVADHAREEFIEESGDLLKAWGSVQSNLMAWPEYYKAVEKIAPRYETEGDWECCQTKPTDTEMKVVRTPTGEIEATTTNRKFKVESSGHLTQRDIVSLMLTLDPTLDHITLTDKFSDNPFLLVTAEGAGFEGVVVGIDENFVKLRQPDGVIINVMKSKIAAVRRPIAKEV